MDDPLPENDSFRQYVSLEIKRTFLLGEERFFFVLSYLFSAMARVL